MALDDLLSQIGEPREESAGTYLFRQGDADDRIYFLLSGFMKAYYVSAEGREHIKSLLSPGAFIGSMAAFGEDGMCTFNLKTQTDCTLRTLRYADLIEAAQKDHALAMELVQFLAGFARKKERREYELLCLSAAERHKRVLEDIAAFSDVFSQADIAAYIGITPQALSRIKKRVSA